MTYRNNSKIEYTDKVAVQLTIAKLRNNKYLDDNSYAELIKSGVINLIKNYTCLFH